MLYKIRSGDNVSLDVLDQLARALGISTPLLVSPTMDSDSQFRSAYDKMRHAYASTTLNGRNSIDTAIRVAEELAQYGPQAQSERS